MAAHRRIELGGFSRAGPVTSRADHQAAIFSRLHERAAIKAVEHDEEWPAATVVHRHLTRKVRLGDAVG